MVPLDEPECGARADGVPAEASVSPAAPASRAVRKARQAREDEER